MAGDWIKMRTDLYRDPKVIIMADLLMDGESQLSRFISQHTQRNSNVTRNVTRNAVVGALVTVWGVARVQGKRVDDDLLIPNVSTSIIDDISELQGLGDAMKFVGWVEESKKGLIFPRFFEENNSDYEDQKRKNRDRQAAYRERKKRNVTVTLRNAPRGEERREENKKSPPPPPSIQRPIPSELEVVAVAGGVVQNEAQVGSATEAAPAASGESWQSITDELNCLGVSDTRNVVEDAARRGLAPEHVGMLIAFWKQHGSGFENPLGALVYRIRGATTKLSPSAGWPKFVEQQAAAMKPERPPRDAWAEFSNPSMVSCFQRMDSEKCFAAFESRYGPKIRAAVERLGIDWLRTIPSLSEPGFEDRKREFLKSVSG